jgi:hypothetical protein
MTRKTTWSNPDGLVVGFGPNYVERNASAVTTQKDGDKKTAKIHIDFKSTFGASGAKLAIPAGSIVELVYMKVTTTWLGGTSLAVGDAGSTGGWITAAQGAEANLTVAAGVINAQGAYAFTATEGQLPPKVFSTATDLFVTSVGTHTAGEADIYVVYS